MTDLFDDFPELEPDEGWMQVTLEAPAEVGSDVIRYLEEKHGFKDVDWCLLGRDADNSKLDFSPCAALTEKPAP